MLASLKNVRRQLGIQILEYSVLGALIVGGGAAAVYLLQTGNSNQLGSLSGCVSNAVNAVNCK